MAGVRDEVEGDQEAQLIGDWTHAHERDAGEALAYVPASTPLPPSRGRSGFAFAADGTVRRIRPGPTDRPEADRGTWRLVDGRLIVQLDGGELLRYVLATPSPGVLMLTRQLDVEEDQ